MRNKTIIIITIITVITIIFSPREFVFAATPSATLKVATPSATTIIDKLKKIEILKEKIATKVAQLREEEKGALFGPIKTINNNSIILSIKQSEQTFSYSEDTIFFRITNGAKGNPLDFREAKKLKENDQVAALGYFDTSHSLLAAKYAYIVRNPIHLTGKIAQRDPNNFTITVKAPQGNIVVDIETYTKIFTFNSKTGLGKGGFTKLKEGDVVHIFATPNVKEENRVIGNKIISLSFSTSPTPTIEKEASPTAKITK